MTRRTLFGLLLLVLPLNARADDTTLGPPTSAVSDQPTATAQILQPTSPQSLQSADAAAGGITVAPNNAGLQNTGSQPQIQNLLKDEATSPHVLPPRSASNLWIWLGLGLILLFGFAGFVVWEQGHWRRQR